MQCLILAGGLGTRIRSVDDTRPKALLDVAGRPFATWQLEWLAGQGVTDVVYSIGHRGSMIREALGDGRGLGLSIDYVEEGDQLRGTGGAVRLAVDLGALDETFFVLYGDSYLTIDLPQVEAAFAASGHPALMTVYDNAGRFDASNAVFDDGLVLRYEKGLADPPPEMHWIDYGLSALRRSTVAELLPSGVVADLAGLFTALSRERALAGFEALERFFEIGSPSGLRELAEHLQGRSGEPV